MFGYLNKPGETNEIMPTEIFLQKRKGKRINHTTSVSLMLTEQYSQSTMGIQKYMEHLIHFLRTNKQTIKS
jgi:hypothetical protein